MAAVGAGQSAMQPLAQNGLTAGSCSGKQANVFSFIANQAALMQVEKAAVGLAVQRKFLLAELSHYLLTSGFKTGIGNVGVKAVFEGSTSFNETQLGVAYARRLGSRVDLGVQFNYQGMRAKGYAAAAGVGAEAGMVVHIGETLHTGIHLVNMTGRGMGGSNTGRLPAGAGLGIGYEAGEQLFFELVTEKFATLPVNVSAAMLYRIVPAIVVKLGIDSQQGAGWVSALFRLSDFQLQFQLTTHPRLGLTPGLALLFQSKQMRDEKQ